MTTWKYDHDCRVLTAPTPEGGDIPADVYEQAMADIQISVIADDADIRESRAHIRMPKYTPDTHLLQEAATVSDGGAALRALRNAFRNGGTWDYPEAVADIRDAVRTLLAQTCRSAASTAIAFARTPDDRRFLMPDAVTVHVTSTGYTATLVWDLDTAAYMIGC